MIPLEIIKRNPVFEEKYLQKDILNALK